MEKCIDIFLFFAVIGATLLPFAAAGATLVIVALYCTFC